MFEYSSVSASSYDPAALVAKLNEAAAEGWDVVSIVPTGGDVSAFLRREGCTSEDEISAEDGMVEAVLAEEAVLDEELAEEACSTRSWPKKRRCSTRSWPRKPFSRRAGGRCGREEWSAGDTAAAGRPGRRRSRSVRRRRDHRGRGGRSGRGHRGAPGRGRRPVEEPAGWAVAPEPPPADTTTDSADGHGRRDPRRGRRARRSSRWPSPCRWRRNPWPSRPRPRPPSPLRSRPARAARRPSPRRRAGTRIRPTRYELRYWDGTQWTEHVARQGQQFTDPPVR